MNRDNDVAVVKDMEPHILETVLIECPKCHAEIRADAKDKEDIVCFCCDRRIRVSDRAGDLKTQVIQETLWLPKGSIRALIALLLSGTCWILVFTGRDVPNYLFDLLVAVISYYFAFRGHSSFSSSAPVPENNVKIDEFADVTSSGKPKPLYLPSGVIRYLLILGFAACAIAGLKQQLFDGYAFREFYIIFSGLIAGYFFAKFANLFKKNVPVYNRITHVKGLMVLVAGIAIALILLSGTSLPPVVALVCSCFITFYFGSKS